MEEKSVGLLVFFFYVYFLFYREFYSHQLPSWGDSSTVQAKALLHLHTNCQLIPVILTLQFVNKHTFPLLIIAMIKRMPLMIKIIKSKSILMTMEH